MYCSNCGSIMDERQAFCPFCSTPNPNYRQNVPPPQYGPYNYGPPQFYRDVSPYSPYNVNPENEPAETPLLVFSAIEPIIGLNAGIASLSRHEKRAGRAYLLAAGISFGVRVLIVIMYVVFSVLLIS